MKVIFCGDSWAMGEWTTGNIDYFTHNFNKNVELVDKGCEKYFNEKISVLNLASLDNDVDKVVEKIKNVYEYPYIKNKSTGKFVFKNLYQDEKNGFYFKSRDDAEKYLTNGDLNLIILTKFIPSFIIVWFQPDITSLVLTENYLVNVKSIDEIFEKRKNVLENYYQKLNDIGFQIYCVGATSKLDVNLMSNYSNLTPLVESISELLYPDYVHPIFWGEELFDFYIKFPKIRDFIKEQLNAKKILTTEQYKHFFGPTGKYLNSNAYKALAEYFEKNVEELKDL